MNYYLFKQNNHPTGLCNTCNVFETIDHYLFNCKESKIGTCLTTKCRELKIDLNLTIALTNKELINVIYNNVDRKR